jgi:hypothetical protein
MSSNLMCMLAVDQEVFGWKVWQEQEAANRHILPTACLSLQPSMTSKAIMIPKWAWIIIW